MINKLIIAISMLLPFYSWGQDPVKWEYIAKKTAPDTYEIRITAKLEPGWHIYSQETAAGGPEPTTISFKKNPLFQVEGKVKEIGKMEQVYEHVFGVEVKQYSNTVTFLQFVRKKSPAKTRLNGTIAFMTCNEEMCLPSDDIAFQLDLQ